MNQTEATQEIALALAAGGIFDNVRIVTPTEGDHPVVILTDVFDVPLSVTVEILSSND